MVGDPFQPQGVKGGHDGDRGAARPGQGGDAAHPVVSVDQVGRLFLPVQGELVAEVAHQRRQFLLGELPGGPGGDVDYLHPGGKADACGLTRRGAPGEHRHVVPLGGQFQGELTDVDVLTSRISAANVLGQRAGVLRYLGDAEREIGHAGSIAHPGSKDTAVPTRSRRQETTRSLRLVP